jgi:hypothetical protein
MNMRSNIFFSLSIFLASLAGCAGVEYEQIPIESKIVSEGSLSTEIEIHNKELSNKNISHDDKARGLRYYQPSPYLLVYSDGQGGINWEIYYLPDPTKKMSVKPYNFLASLKAKFTFDEKNGVIKSTREEGDSTIIPKAIFEQAKALAPLLLKAMADDVEKAKNQYKVPTPYLFKFVSSKGRFKLVGGQGDMKFIHVTLGKKLGSTGPSNEPQNNGGQNIQGNTNPGASGSSEGGDKQ